MMILAVAGVAFSIPAGTLNETLIEWSKQSNSELVFDYDTVRGLNSKGFTCEDCSRYAALYGVLEGLPIAWEAIGDAVAIRRPEGHDPHSFAYSGDWYYCTDLGAWAGFLLTRAERLTLHMGKIDLQGLMLCNAEGVLRNIDNKAKGSTPEVIGEG